MCFPAKIQGDEDGDCFARRVSSILAHFAVCIDVEVTSRLAGASFISALPQGGEWFWQGGVLYVCVIALVLEGRFSRRRQSPELP